MDNTWKTLWSPFHVVLDISWMEHQKLLARLQEIGLLSLQDVQVMKRILYTVMLGTLVYQMQISLIS